MPLDTEWWLERNDRRILFARHGTTALFADTGTAAVSEHGHPAWKLVLPVRGERVEVYSRSGGRLDAPAVLVPPRWRHRSRVENGYVGLFLDAHTLPPHSGPIAVTRCAADRLRAALAIGPDVDSPPDLPAARAELLRMYGPATSPDPRITLALAHFDDTTTLTDLAREVGLSAPRLRALVQERVGVPLATLRRWYRLRNALTALRGGTIADAAADAGFADHAHLARTARDMLGRSPSSLTRPNVASWVGVMPPVTTSHSPEASIPATDRLPDRRDHAAAAVGGGLPRRAPRPRHIGADAVDEFPTMADGRRDSPVGPDGEPPMPRAR